VPARRGQIFKASDAGASCTASADTQTVVDTAIYSLLRPDHSFPEGPQMPILGPTAGRQHNSCFVAAQGLEVWQVGLLGGDARQDSGLFSFRILARSRLGPKAFNELACTPSHHEPCAAGATTAPLAGDSARFANHIKEQIGWHQAALQAHGAV